MQRLLSFSVRRSLNSQPLLSAQLILLRMYFCKKKQNIFWWDAFFNPLFYVLSLISELLTNRAQVEALFTFQSNSVAFVEKTNLNFNPWSETCQLIRLTVAIWTWNLNDVNFIPFSWLSSSHHCKMEKKHLYKTYVHVFEQLYWI